MKAAVILCTVLLAGSAIAQTKDQPKLQCPRDKPGFGICVFNPEIHCTGDDKCKDGQICCPDGCNRKCKDGVPTTEAKTSVPRLDSSEEEAEDKCPPTPPTFGACIFNPDINCVDNSACKNGQVCCSEGCNKVCKDAFRPVKPSTKPWIPTDGDRCPPVPPTIGACVFNPEVNCVDDSACQGGQVCCSDGCNKVCRDTFGPAKPTPVVPEEKNVTSGGQCPPVPPTIGACVFKPEVNCVDDSACKSGQVCCSDGCNKVCRDAFGPAVATPAPEEEKKERSQGKCPPVPPTFGACVFNPEVNCVDDSACKGGQVCCSDGCNKVCKDAFESSAPPTPVEETNKGPQTNDKCPKVTPTFGACVFNPEVNCKDDSVCKNGQVCCPSGCNRVCVNPAPVHVHEATKP